MIHFSDRAPSPEKISQMIESSYITQDQYNKLFGHGRELDHVLYVFGGTESESDLKIPRARHSFFLA